MSSNDNFTRPELPVLPSPNSTSNSFTCIVNFNYATALYTTRSRGTSIQIRKRIHVEVERKEVRVCTHTDGKIYGTFNCNRTIELYNRENNFCGKCVTIVFVMINMCAYRHYYYFSVRITDIHSALKTIIIIVILTILSHRCVRENKSCARMCLVGVQVR